ALQQVFAALARSNANAGGNYIEHGEEQYVVRGLGTLAKLEDIEQVVIAARGGIPIRIRDIADVTIGPFPRRGVVTRDGEFEAVIVARVIPLSLLGAFRYLKLRGLSANLLSLGAVDFGIIVDGAVIMVEHVARRLAGVTARRDAQWVMLEAAEEVARPTLFAL